MMQNVKKQCHVFYMLVHILIGYCLTSVNRPITILIDMDNGRAVNECRVYGKCNSWYILNVISSISQKPCAWGWWWLFAPYKDKLSAPVHHLIIYFCQSKYSFVVFKVKTAFIRNLHELKVMVFLLVRVMVFNATFNNISVISPRYSCNSVERGVKHDNLSPNPNIKIQKTMSALIHF
jgi:hypothetical protein